MQMAGRECFTLAHLQVNALFKSAWFCALSYALVRTNQRPTKSTLGQINYGIAGEDHALHVIFVNHANRSESVASGAHNVCGGSHLTE
jgi:hypothetical protein